MKATKKIVGAACALVAAVALSAGSTFAWFSASGKVTASGMKVQAVVPTNLYIAIGPQTSADNITETAIDFEDATASALNPANVAWASETLTVNDVDEYKTEPTPGTAGEADTYIAQGTVTLADGAVNATDKIVKDYVYVQRMSLVKKAAEGSTDKISLNAEVSVSYTVTTANTLGFLKCGFIVGGDTIEWKAMSGEWASDKTTFTGLVKSLKDNTIQQVAFVVWYDGDDTDCYSNNAVNVEEMSFSITFTSGAEITT